jgi:hypothetical protein
MSEPRSILICRLSAMGDVVLSIPVADALRERYPNAQIAFLSREPWANILHCVPSISRVLVWPGPGAPLPDEAARRSWDLVIDLSVFFARARRPCGVSRSCICAVWAAGGCASRRRSIACSLRWLLWE